MSSALAMILMAGMAVLGNGTKKVNQVKRVSLITFCCLFCFLSPVAIAVLGMKYGPESDPGMETPWSLYAIDSLCWADACFTGLMIWVAREWRWLTAMVAIPLLLLTAVLAFFNGLWVSGDYF